MRALLAGFAHFLHGAELEKIRAGKRPAARAEARASETDPESRIMKQGNGGYGPSYNVQVNTDVSSTVIVGWESHRRRSIATN